MQTSTAKDLPDRDPSQGELFLAGARVPAGTYRQIETNREIVFNTEDYLPGSLDGRVACYERAAGRWNHLQTQSLD